MNFRRLISYLLIFCLLFTQTAQAYSLARLPNQTQRPSAGISLINNKGDIGQTLNDLGKSENVKSLVTAMLTAGVLSGLSQNLDILAKDSAGNAITAKSPFLDQLQKNVINNATGAVINNAVYGGDLQQMLEQSLKSAFIDAGAASSANWIGDMKADGTFNEFTHKLAHAIAGCAAGAAKAGDCSSGALGAVVGELAAEMYGGDRSNAGPDLPEFKTDTVNFAKMMAGVAAAITGGDAEAINLASAAGGNAAENNFLGHTAQNERDQLREKAKKDGLTTQESATLVQLELADQMSDELLNKYRSGAPLTEDDEYNLGFYLWAYKQQDGAQATADLIKNGPTPTYDFPYAGSTANQQTAMDTLREQNGGGILAYLITGRPESENQEIFFEAMRDSGMGGSMFGGVNPNESYLPSANKYDFSTLDALRNSPVLGTGTYLIGTGIGADPDSVNAATLFMSNLSDVLSAPVLPKVGLGPAYGVIQANMAASVNGVAPNVNWGQQGKHIFGDNSYIPGRSTINSEVDPQVLLNGVNTGLYPVVGNGARGHMIIDFGRPIGVDATTGLPTQFGTIHSGNGGAHIVPANPTIVNRSR